MRDGLRSSADAVENFIEGCEALRGRVGHQVVAEHLDLTLKRMRALRDDLVERADTGASGDAVFIALGQGAAGLASLADAFAQMHRRYKATMPGTHEPVGWFEEQPQDGADEADEVPI